MDYLNDVLIFGTFLTSIKSDVILNNFKYKNEENYFELYVKDDIINVSLNDKIITIKYNNSDTIPCFINHKELTGLINNDNLTNKTHQIKKEIEQYKKELKNLPLLYFIKIIKYKINIKELYQQLLSANNEIMENEYVNKEFMKHNQEIISELDNKFINEIYEDINRWLKDGYTIKLENI